MNLIFNLFHRRHISVRQPPGRSVLFLHKRGSGIVFLLVGVIGAELKDSGLSPEAVYAGALHNDVGRLPAALRRRNNFMGHKRPVGFTPHELHVFAFLLRPCHVAGNILFGKEIPRACSQISHGDRNPLRLLLKDGHLALNGLSVLILVLAAVPDAPDIGKIPCLNVTRIDNPAFDAGNARDHNRALRQRHFVDYRISGALDNACFKRREPLKVAAV